MVYEEVEIEDMDFVEAEMAFFYQCPCGDKFVISVDELLDGEEVASCPSCSLQIRVIYDPEDIMERFGEASDGEKEVGEEEIDLEA